MKKKAISIITTALLLFTVVALLVGTASLGRTGKSEHVHSFRTIGTTATCIEGGIRTEVCVSCKQERSMPDEPLGHTFVGYFCSVCGEVDGLFTFEVNAGAYSSGTLYAEQGMTWAQWVASEYNTGGFMDEGKFYIDGDYVRVGGGEAISYTRGENSYVKPSDTIIDGRGYRIDRDS